MGSSRHKDCSSVHRTEYIFHAIDAGIGLLNIEFPVIRTCRITPCFHTHAQVVNFKIHLH
jgi:hypothetical protein